MSEARSRVFGLDLVRALAVLLVVGAHVNFIFLPLTGPVEAWLMLGQYGVEMFFALSGFLIGGILIDEAASGAGWVRRFWIRRWLRTLPLYYLFLLFNALMPTPDGSAPSLLAYGLFVQNLAWPQPMFFIESWSLAVEEVFYLLAPLLAFAAMALRMPRRRAWGALVATILGLILVRAAYVALRGPDWDGVRMVSLVRLDAIAYGVAAVWLIRTGLSVRAARWLAVIGGVGVAASVLWYLTLPRDTNAVAQIGLFSLIPASFAALLPLAARWREAGVGFMAGAVHRTALWSYALYLTHLAVLRVLVHAFGWQPVTWRACVAQTLLALIAAFVAAAVIHHGVERPILRWRDRIAPRRGRDLAQAMPGTRQAA